MTDLGVVIVTYRSQAVLPGLLASLTACEPDARVVVVDSASPDGPPQVTAGTTLVTMEENRGFGSACNRGAAELIEASEYLCFLNPDIRVTGPTLTEMAQALELSPEIGVATTQLVDGSGVPVASAWGPTSVPRALWAGAGLRLPRLRRLVGRVLRQGAFASGASASAEEHGQPLEVSGHVVGGAMMVRAACWRQLGGFDEGYFMFWEDADLCLRARSLGWKVSVLTTPTITHIGAASSEGVTEAQRWEWYLAGARRFTQLHLGRWRSRSVLAGLRAGRFLRMRGRS